MKIKNKHTNVQSIIMTYPESNKEKVFQMYLSVSYWVTNYHWQSVLPTHKKSRYSSVDVVDDLRERFFAVGKTRYFADVTVIIYRKVI